MAGVKISNLPAATTPLAGTEPLAIVQGGVTVQVPASALGTASTPVVGILKGTGSAIAAAVAGTDYLAPGGAGSFTSLSVSGSSTLTGGATVQGLTAGKGANAVLGNTAFGLTALAFNTTGNLNSAIGSGALLYNTIGDDNSAVGGNALRNNTIGSYNSSVGVGALTGNIDGSSNSAMGSFSLQNNVSGNTNSAFGYSALLANTGSTNLAIGYSAGSSLTTGNNNTIIGSVAGTAGLSDTVIIAAGSTEKVRFGSTGLMTVGGSALIGSAATNFTQKFQSISTTGQSNAMFFKTVANATGPDITMAKSRNGSSDPTAFTAVINGDTLGAFQFGGTDGSAVITNGVVGGYVDGVVGAGVVPTALTFATGPTNAALSRMNISSAGIVSMYVYGAGTATFSAAGVISSVSDETYKIKDGVIADPMPMIMALKPGYYFGKPEANMGPDRQLGFYAQNVRAAIGPEAAPDPEPSKPWGYFDRSVLAVAIEAIKVLTARIEALEAK